MTTHALPIQTQSRWTNASLLVAGLAAASLVELAILRNFTRTAVHIPALERLRSPYEVLTLTGEYMYFVCIALLVPATAVLVRQLFEKAVPYRALAGFAVMLFAGPAILASFGVASAPALDFATLAAVLALTFAVAMSAPRARAAIPFVCFGVSFVATGAFNVPSSLQSLGLSVNQPTALLNLGEVLGVVFALSTPLMLSSRNDAVARRLGLAAGAAVLLVFLGSGATARFLLLWNVGLAGIVPGFVYALAFAALVFTVVSLLRERSFLAASGLVLLIAGGIGLHSTYQSALVVVGLLACLAAGTERRAYQPSPATESGQLHATRESVAALPN